MTPPPIQANEAFFIEPSYLIRRKVFKLLGGAFHVYDSAGNVVAFSKMSAFKLKEKIRVYNDESVSVELFRIEARNIIDFSAAYDVIDSRTEKKIGTLKRKGFSSIVRDAWIIMDENDREIGSILEDSASLALLRRLVAITQWFLPQVYHATCQLPAPAPSGPGLNYASPPPMREICRFKQNINPFVQKIGVDFDPAIDQLLDRRLMIAAGLLLLAIEGRQAG